MVGLFCCCDGKTLFQCAFPWITLNYFETEWLQLEKMRKETFLIKQTNGCNRAIFFWLISFEGKEKKNHRNIGQPNQLTEHLHTRYNWNRWGGRWASMKYYLQFEKWFWNGQFKFKPFAKMVFKWLKKIKLKWNDQKKLSIFNQTGAHT